MSRTSTFRLRHRVSALAAGLGVAALALAACSGGGEAGEGAGPSQPTTGEATTRAQRLPFTGEVVDGDVPQRRGIVVKIDNSDKAQPQTGLGSADLVVEQLVEGGTTRLAVLFHSALPRKAGPVRSVRASDIGIVSPTDALLAASGGAPQTVRRIRDADIDLATEGAPGFSRDPSRSAPYNLMLDVARLSDTDQPADPPPDYLPWGRPGALRGGEPARTVTARFSPAHTATWTFASSRWRRSPNFAAAGDDIAVDSVLVLRVRLVDAGYRDPAGNPVPETVLTGKGAATLFSGGRAYAATWTKRSAGAPLRLVTARGEPLRVPPGHTWIELVPTTQGGDLRFRR
ncbi:MAG: DUF3048 domain-containing protein [Actinomycetota bacterium]|nr:DUF3048 domain-containing protein [Actinomycetota bacterium]